VRESGGGKKLCVARFEDISTAQKTEHQDQDLTEHA
jgi:hypothetical protein